ncbi:hypothetical protein [Pilimelia columellifera]|uniref:Uncharacterized protein n=1 Tax=Pilimelia columellifera subsp. columellifera TaxID=706583 RepID=A0ABN3NT19_9ACTN
MSPRAAVMRRTHAAPADLTFAAGRVCPIDGAALTVTRRGWNCPDCLAGWNYQGRRGRWLADDVMVIAEAFDVVAPAATPARRPGLRPAEWAAVVALVGSATVVAGYTMGAARRGEQLPVPDSVLYAVAALILLVGAVAITLDVRRGGVR